MRFQHGDRVRVVHPDSSYCGQIGEVIAIRYGSCSHSYGVRFRIRAGRTWFYKAYWFREDVLAPTLVSWLSSQLWQQIRRRLCR